MNRSLAFLPYCGTCSQLLTGVTVVTALVACPTAEARSVFRSEQLIAARAVRGKVPHPPARAKKPAGGKAKGGKKQNESAVQAATGAAAFAREHANAAADAVRDAASQLRKTEDELIEVQDEDSPVAVAKARFEKAQRKHKNASDHVLESPEYRQALARLGDGADRQPEDVARLRETMITNNEAVIAAASEMAAARAEYHDLRKKLFESDTVWKEAVANLKLLRKEQDDAEAEAQVATARKNRAEDDVERAQRQARLAALQKKQAELTKKQAAATKERRNAQLAKQRIQQQKQKQKQQQQKQKARR